MTEQLLKISNSHVRNLTWLLFSPIMRVYEEYESEALLFPPKLQDEWLMLHEKWLVDLDQRPNELNLFLAKRKNVSRLGFYAENLLQFFFSASPFIDLIWCNKQVVIEGITATEIDFVIRYENRLIHIELAVKFYLLDPSGEWVGPNGNDTLKTKWDKVILLQIPVATHIIKENFPSESLESYFFIKGFLFRRDEDLTNQWLYQEEINKVNDDGYRFAFPQKPNWMADFSQYKGKTINEREFATRIGSEKTKAIPVISLSKKNKQKNYFIVPSSWPD